MKFKAATLRTFTTLHTWVGLVAGFALFVAFYAGAITVFHHELQAWQSVDARTPQTIDDAQQLLDQTLQRHPAARSHVGMLFPGPEAPRPVIYWQDEAGTWLFASLDDLEGSEKPGGAGLSELVNALHYSLGIPVAGTYLMGIVSLLYGVALISGVVIHLPRLSKDLFALRPGRNLKRFWQDAHNIVGVLGLPMHIMFAVTGAMLCLVMLTMLALDPVVYRGGTMAALPAAMDTAPVRAASGMPAGPGSLRMWHARSIEEARAQGVEDFEPAYLKLANGTDANAVVEVTGATGRAVGALGAVALDAGSGQLLASQLPGARDANHATLAAAYALHFGEYGNVWIKALYFILGIGGAFLFYSGNLLWVESRRKRRQFAQGAAQIGMARATVGICLGVCVAISAAFVAAQVLEHLAMARTIDIDAGIHWTAFLTWFACAAWAAARPPTLAARELAWAAAVVTSMVPVAHGLATGAWPWITADSGQWALFSIDVGALAMAAGFAAIARAVSRRARSGDPHSVWAVGQVALH